MQLQGLFLSVTTLIMSTTALDLNSLNTTNRYIPGPIQHFAPQMERDLAGGKGLGKDGVLRSFANNGTVLDYHQLDPSQVKQFIEDQLAAWKLTGQPVPIELAELVNPPYVDGRVVTDLQALLHPVDKPQFASAELASRTVWSPSAVFERRDLCAGKHCQSLETCTNNFIDTCNECYFVGGPPSGACRK